MGIVYFTCYGVAAPQGSKVKTRHGMRESSARLKPWRGQVALAAAEEMHRQGHGTRVLDGPVRVHATFILPRPKGHFGTGKNAAKLKLSAPVYPTVAPDVDKCARAILDAITGIIVRDDSQVADLYAAKRYGEPARVEVSVAEMQEEA